MKSNKLVGVGAYGLAVLLAVLVVWIAIVFLFGAVLAWGAEGHLEVIFDREIPFYNLWMLCSLTIAFFGRMTDLRPTKETK